MEEFSKNNSFDGCSIKTSAKTGININEAIEYLIVKILERKENMEPHDENIFEKKNDIVAQDKKKKLIKKEMKRKKKNQLMIIKKFF